MLSIGTIVAFLYFIHVMNAPPNCLARFGCTNLSTDRCIRIMKLHIYIYDDIYIYIYLCLYKAYKL